MSAAAPFQLNLSASSTLFQYLPSRDGTQDSGWNASYTGMNVWPEGGADQSAGRAVGFPYRGTTAGRASVSTSFDGTGLYLCFKSNNAGVAMTLDNKLYDTKGDAATLCSAFKGEADTVLVANNLEQTTHSVLLQVSASAAQEFRFFGGGITVAVNTAGKTVETHIVDDTDPNWTYSPNSGNLAWDPRQAGGHLINTTGHFQCNYGPDYRAAYSFTGASGIIISGNVWTDSHAFSVVVDSQTFNMDATGSWEEGTTVLFAKADLDPTKPHTVALVNHNSDVPDCRSQNGGGFCCSSLDALTLLVPGTTNLAGSNNGTNLPSNEISNESKSNIGPIVGGVIGGLLLALAILLVAFFVMRRRRRTDTEAGHHATGVGQPMLSEEHVPRPAFFNGQATSYAPSMQSGLAPAPVSNMSYQSNGHADPYAISNHTQSIHSGGVPVPVGPLSPHSMYSQQPTAYPAQTPMQQQHQEQPAWLQPVVATGDRKVRTGIGAGGTGVVAPPVPVSNPSSLYHAGSTGSQPNAPRSNGSSSGVGPYGGIASGDGQQPGGGPRLAQEDLEHVLAFIAQRMDRPGAAPQAVSTGPRSDGGDELPEYRS